MQTIRYRLTRSTGETIDFVLSGLLAVVTIAVFVKSPFDWLLLDISATHGEERVDWTRR